MNDNDTNRMIEVLWDIKLELNQYAKTNSGTSFASNIIKNQREIIDLLGDILIELRNRREH